MEGILISLDRAKKSGTVDSRNDKVGVLPILFREITDAVQVNCTVIFNVVTDAAGKRCAEFVAVADRNQALFNTEDRDKWYAHGEKKEKVFVEQIVPRLREKIDLQINPEKAKTAWAIDLYDNTNKRYADLKVQDTPFFTCGRFMYGREHYDPTYTVTFNKKDYENYRVSHPDCDIYFWVNWTQLTYKDKSVAPLYGVWRAPFSKMAEKIQRGEVYLHSYIHRQNDDHNATESYLFNLNDTAVFERLL